MVEMSAKKRHQILNNRIRAFYGHSTSKKINKNECVPPIILYHGTPLSRMESIFTHGLLKMQRQYVHLSEDRNTADIVGNRNGEKAGILTILARVAHDSGVQFYKEENGIWLSDYIPVEFIKL